MRDVTVRLVFVDDERTSTTRATRTDAYALRTGERIQVKVAGKWVNCWIVGSAHSELRVSTTRPVEHHRHLTRPEQD